MPTSHDKSLESQWLSHLGANRPPGGLRGTHSAGPLEFLIQCFGVDWHLYFYQVRVMLLLVQEAHLETHCQQ